MGQIAPRRRKTRQPAFLPLLRVKKVLNALLQRMSRSQERMMSKESHQSVFQRLWHWSDHQRWMDPLPPQHRRGIILAAAIVLLAFLWPASRTSLTPPPATTENSVPLQAEIIDNGATDQTQQDNQGQQWRSYQIAAGQTLAQLFRDNNLPVNEVFAMAREEGSDKPLSTLSAGQTVKVRFNAQGTITALTVDGSNGPVLFTRQQDGSYLRAR